MRHFQALAFSTCLAAGIVAAPLGAAMAQTCACPTDQQGAADGAGAGVAAVYADDAPPPLPEYDQPPIPAPGYYWTPGYWAWNSYEYFWVPGTWIEPPQPGLLWTPGYWAFVNGAYAFHRGYWGEHIGFYGGVDYGFGYGGAGYEGGRWDNGRFFYNRSVTNIGEVKITEIYNQPVTTHANNRASFNGPNGSDAKPTPEELEAAKQQHVAPTRDQINNARLASRNESAFVTNNKGKPRIAATAKPGVFQGAAVVPAKAAGGPIEPTNTETPLSKKLDSEKKPGEPTPEATTPKAEKTIEPKSSEPKSTEPKSTEPKSTEPKSDKTLEPKSGKTLEPKSDLTKPEPTKTELGAPEPKKTGTETKFDQPKSEPTKSEVVKPSNEQKFERPKPEPTKTQPELKAEPKPEPMQMKPENRPEQRRLEPTPKGPPQGKPEAGCGHPGESACPK